MLVVKRSAGVISEVFLKNPLHAGNEALKRGIHSKFETLVDVTRSPKLMIVALQNFENKKFFSQRALHKGIYYYFKRLK